MRSITVYEKSDEQLRWAFEKDEAVTCRVRIPGNRCEMEFEVKDLEEHLYETGGNYLVPVDMDTMIILTEEDVLELVMSHRTAIVEVDDTVDCCEDLGKQIGEALAYTIEGMINEPKEHTIEDVIETRDAVVRKLQGILKDLEDGAW